jgi:hypothetical protein
MSHICRNPVAGNGRASGDTYSNHLSSRNSVSVKKNQSAINYDDLVALACGAVSDVACPLCGPGRRSSENRKRRVLRIWLSNDGFASFFCARCAVRGWARDNEASGCVRTARTAWPGTISPVQPDAGQRGRIESALGICQESKPLDGTLGWRYFSERRGLAIGTLDLNPYLRFHHSEVAVVGLMTDPVTGEATGVHRTYLNRDGTKRERKMLGRMGVVRLSDSVEQSLGITEGIEDGLALLLAGHSPIWAATCCGSIERFPAIDVDHLNIFADNDAAGEAAAERLATRYEAAGKRVRLHWPPDQFKDWCAALAEGGAL